MPTGRGHKLGPEKPYDRSMLYGLREIAEYMRYSEDTIAKWAKKHAFPIIKTPDGLYMSSTELIDRWILARWKVQQDRLSRAAKGQE